MESTTTIYIISHLLPFLQMSTLKERKAWRKKQSAYYEENRESWNEYQREYKKRKYAEDPEYRARMKEYARHRRQEKKNEDA